MANEKNDARQWFLRIAGGTVFGPVSSKGLIVWAEQGRIVPGNEVSSDRETWLPAEQVPELEMTWYVNAGSKTEGPFNRIAAESFLKSGKAPAGAKLIESKDVDPAVLTRHSTPETDAAPERPAPAEPKPPATGRHGAEARIAELEAALEKQRETLTAARQSAKTQAALEDERDELRKQMQGLQAQMESLRTNAEKDAQKRERRLDALKQEVARLQQEQAAAKTSPMLELETATAAIRVEAEGDDPRQAIEELRRQAGDERRVLERDAEQLRARIDKLESELVRAHAAAEEARKRATILAPAVDPELQQTCDTLKKELADAQSDKQVLQRKSTDLDQRVAELASQVGQLETERRKLMGEREKLQQQLGVAMSEATDATNEAANSSLRRRAEQLEAVNEGMRTQLAQSDQALAAERTALAELLAASNERDLASGQRLADLEKRQAELEARLRDQGTASEREAKLMAEAMAARARIAELQGRIARLPETPAAAGRAAPAPEAAGWLRQFATDELTTLDKALHEERESFNEFRGLSTSRQEAIQARIQAIQRLLSGDFPDARRASTPGQRIAGLDQSRLQNEVDSIRVAQQKETKQFEERESELLRRVRVLETEEARLRSLLEATDMEGGKKIELMETIRRREQELAQERRIRDQDREQFESARHALTRRIEELERAAGISTESRPPMDDPAAADKPRRLPGIGSWLKR